MYDLTDKLDKLNLAQLRELVENIYNEVYVEGPDTEWNPDNIEAVARRLHEVGLHAPLKCETPGAEMLDRIEAAFAASDHYTQFDDSNYDFAVSAEFEHGQWWVHVAVDADPKEVDKVTFLYSVVDAEPGIDGFDFEEV